jgi:nucleotide-binding universal stress UspA family protein
MISTTTGFNVPVSTIDSQIRYQKILVPHDGSDMSDKALSHASFLSKITGAEIVLLNVIEPDIIPPSTLLSFIKSDAPLETAKEELRNTLEGAVKQMLNERIERCKNAGVSKITFKIAIGKPINEIVKLSEEMHFDIIIMASSRISSSVRVLGSTARKVIDSIRKPVIIIHE